MFAFLYLSLAIFYLHLLPFFSNEFGSVFLCQKWQLLLMSHQCHLNLSFCMQMAQKQNDVQVTLEQSHAQVQEVRHQLTKHVVPYETHTKFSFWLCGVCVSLLQHFYCPNSILFYISHHLSFFKIKSHFWFLTIPCCPHHRLSPPPPYPSSVYLLPF